jgi:steroid 5-alpha reductase family enzyme
MTLPALISLEECSDWSKTVEPFIPQLYDLPKRLFETVQTGGSLLEVYKTTNPLISGFAFSVFLGAVFLVAAEINRNYSQVDRFWSLLPTFYIAHFDIWARLTGVPHQRIDLALLFSTLWSVSTLNWRLLIVGNMTNCYAAQIRLTYNYWRKGGYEIGSEDYRWLVPEPWQHISLNWRS